MKNYLTAILVLVALSAVQCKKAAQGDQLPPITTTGANTFGCKVNGNVWLPYSLYHTGSIYAMWVQGPNNDAYKIDPSISIYTFNRSQQKITNVGIDLNGIMDTGTFQIRDLLSDGLSYSDGELDYEPVDTFGTVKILRLDTIADIVSGTFSFNGINRQFSKTVNITDGRFDVHWPYKQ